MKRILPALLLVIAANAYSIDIKAQVYGGFNLFGFSTNFDRPISLFELNSGKVQLEAEAARDNFGGWFRLGYNFKETYFGEFDVWWKQSEKFGLYITYKDAGHFALNDITGQSYFGLCGDVLALQGCAGTHAFYDGFNRGVFVNFSPNEPFNIFLGLELFNPDIPEYMLKSAALQLVYSFETKSKLGFTVESNYMTEASLDDNPVFLLYYSFPYKENLEFEIGASYKIWETRKKEDVAETRFHPVNLGAASVYNGEKIKFKTRLHVNFLGHNTIKTPEETTKTKRPFDIGLDVLPYQVFTQNFTGYLNAGIGLSFPEKGKTDVFWRLNPYIIIGKETDAAFYAGLDIFSPAFYPREVRLNIAAGLSIAF